MVVMVALKIKMYKCSECGKLYRQRDVFISMPTANKYGMNCVDHKDKNGDWLF